MSEFPKALKHLTVWLLAGTGVFVAVQAYQSQQQASRITVGAGVVELRRARDGHFHWPGTVNGQAVDFLVDTGATRTALPAALAQGLVAEAQVQSNTAGGTVQGYTVRVDLRLQGGVQASGLPVTVLPALGAPLLGMDVLSRLRFTQDGGVLRLQPPASP